MKRIQFIKGICLGNPIFGFDFLIDRHMAYLGRRDYIVPLQIQISLTLCRYLVGFNINLGKFYKI